MLPALPLDTKDAAGQPADIAWMLVSTALVLFMVPGLALFYCGMVRRKNVLGTMMHSMIAICIIGLQWMLFGYSLAFGESQGGWIGWSWEFVGLMSPDFDTEVFPGTKLPITLHCLYQGMFAIITPALISGAFAERVKFGPYCLFIFLWSTLVYDPLAHWVWAIGLTADGKPTAAGWLGQMGALDFAGGTVVHVSAGVAGLAAIMLLPRRIGYPHHAIHPNGLVLTLSGAGILWFGWFGFNGGSALAANALAVFAVAATQAAAAAAGASWLLAEWLHRGKPTALGLASGVVAGLVAVTPASGYVTPAGAMAIGAISGFVCYGAVCLKPVLKYDDSLDAFGVHGIGGILGALLTGVFASQELWQAGTGSKDALGKLADGMAAQIGVQLIATLAAAAYSFAVTAVLVKAIDLTLGFGLDAKGQTIGLDQTLHGEVGFDDGLGDLTLESPSPEPKPASEPPVAGRRFTVVVDGATPDDLAAAWSKLCQPAEQPAADFKAVYPYMTTVSGNRFRFRGGDPVALRQSLERLLQDHVGGRVQTYVE